MTLIYTLLTFYIAAWTRLVLHELSHYIVGRFYRLEVVAVTLGGETFKFKNRYDWRIGFVPFTGMVAFKHWGQLPASLYLAGPMMDIFVSIVMGVLAFFFLPLIPSYAVFTICITALVNTLEGRCYEGQDLFEYFRLTDLKKPDSLSSCTR